MFAPRETERLEVVGLEELDDVEPLMAGYAAGWARHVEVVVDLLHWRHCAVVVNLVLMSDSSAPFLFRVAVDVPCCCWVTADLL